MSETTIVTGAYSAFVARCSCGWASKVVGKDKAFKLRDAHAKGHDSKKDKKKAVKRKKAAPKLPRPASASSAGLSVRAVTVDEEETSHTWDDETCIP